jgi:long-chain fatty acid transport protein
MRRLLLWLAVGALVTLAPREGRAQGYSVNEHSSCAMGRAGTAVASPCPDGSALVYNPAGLALTRKGHGVITVSGTFIAPRGNFTSDATGLVSDLNNKVYPVPAVYATYGLTDRVSVGLGFFAPYGLTTDWPTTAEGRYAGYKSVIRAMYLQPSIAVKISNQVMVGGGVDITFTHVELHQRVDLSTAPLPPPAPAGITLGNLGIPAGTDFADINLHGNGTSPGFHAGVILQPVERLSFGVRYLSRQKVTIDNGTAEISQVPTGLVLPPGNPIAAGLGNPALSIDIDQLVAPLFSGSGPLITQGASTALRFPEQWTFGVAGDVTSNLKLLFDVTATNWSVFDALALKFDVLDPLGNGSNAVTYPENYDWTTAFRFGGQYSLGPGTVVRLGYLLHNAASPDQTVTPNLPEGKRNEFTVGFGTGLTKGLHVDLAYQYISQADRRGRSFPIIAGVPAPVTTNGLYHFTANLFAATLSYAF